MAKIIATNHIGTTVLLSIPIPKWRNDPSFSKIKAGLAIKIQEYNIINNKIE